MIPCPKDATPDLHELWLTWTDEEQRNYLWVRQQFAELEDWIKLAEMPITSRVQ